MAKNIKNVSDLIPDAANANKGTERGRYAVEASLRETGAGRSIVVDKEGRIIAGNKTLEAWADINGEIEIIKTNGKKLIVVQREDLDLDDVEGLARKLAYYDNRAGQLGLEWDAEQLFSDLNAGVDLSGMFFDDEIADILATIEGYETPTAGEDPGADVSKADELQAVWNVQLGDLWQLGDHRLICGDCTDAAVVERVMGGEKADAVVTDPPYGQNQAGVTNDAPELLSGIVSGAIRQLPVSNAVIVAFSSPRTFPVWLDSAREAGHKFERMLWMYKAAQETFPWRGWLLTSEAILATSVGTGQWQDVHPYSHDCYYKSEVSGQLGENSGWHGSVKPLDVVEDLTQRICSRNSVVYEPFSGSGTTIIACENLGRRCRAVELHPPYVAVALQRWADMTGQTPIKLTN